MFLPVWKKKKKVNYFVRKSIIQNVVNNVLPIFVYFVTWQNHLTTHEPSHIYGLHYCLSLVFFIFSGKSQ